MEQFIVWLAGSFYALISKLVSQSVFLIDNAITEVGIPNHITSLQDIDVNLVLFSDTPIFSMSGYSLAVLFFSVFYTIIFIVIAYKIIKKVIVKITGWNRW